MRLPLLIRSNTFTENPLYAGKTGTIPVFQDIGVGKINPLLSWIVQRVGGDKQ